MQTITPSALKFQPLSAQQMCPSYNNAAMMLESIGWNATILDKCLEYPDDAIHLVKAQKPQILLDNILSVISSGLNHPSANFVAMVAGDGYSWCRLRLGILKGAGSWQPWHRTITKDTPPDWKKSAST